MDHQIIRNLFANTIEASEILGVDPEFRAEADRSSASASPPTRSASTANCRNGSKTSTTPRTATATSRICGASSPASEITPDTPELLAAARKSLEFRGDGGTGWSLAWKINLWARLGDGNHAHRMLDNLLTLTDSPKTNYNGRRRLHESVRRPSAVPDRRQLRRHQRHLRDAAAIAPPLRDGSRLVELLPALPAAWPTGEVPGFAGTDLRSI